MDAIRNMYSELGVDEFSKEYGKECTYNIDVKGE